MRKSAHTALYFIVLILVAGCNHGSEEPLASPTPHIDSIDLSFIDNPDNSQADTLKLILNFTDGDFDLGLDWLNPGDIDSPYHAMDYFIITSKGLAQFRQSIVTGDARNHVLLETDHTGKLASINALKNHGFETPFYNCLDYSQGSVLVPGAFVDETYNIVDVYEGNIFEVEDTLLVKYNDNHYNINVEFLVETNGLFETFDWQELYCASFDGRFPLVSNTKTNGVTKSGPFTHIRKSKSKGELTYSMTSLGFKILFGRKTIKLKIQIIDRALNRSNVFETFPFTLE